MVSHRVRQEEAGNGANSASSLSTEKLPWQLGGAHFGGRKRPLSNWSYMRPYCTLVGSRFDHRMLAQPPVHLAYHVGAKRSMRPFFISIYFGWVPAEQINPFSMTAPKAGVFSPNTTSEAPGVGSQNRPGMI
jgi:hypothetical protein